MKKNIFKLHEITTLIIFIILNLLIINNVFAKPFNFFANFGYGGIGGGWDRVNDFAYQEYANCGYNLTMDDTTQQDETDLDLAHQKGLKVMPVWTDNWKYDWDDYQPSELDARAKEMVSKYASHPATFAYYLTDEPHTKKFSGLAYAHRKLQLLDPNHIPVVNLFPNYASPKQLGAPNYEAYLERFIRQVRPKVLSWDSYNYDAWGQHGNFEIMRKYGLKYNIPLWFIYHASDCWGVKTNTMGQMAWNVYSALAYGVKGLSPFMYYSSPAHCKNAILNNDSSKNQLYYYQQKINAVINRLGKILINCTSTAIYHTAIPNRGRGIRPSDLVTAVSGGDAIMGEFRDNRNNTYIMLVNNNYKQSKTISFRFNRIVNELYIVDKITGRLKPMRMRGNTVRINFPAGEGELLKVRKRF